MSDSCVAVGQFRTLSLLSDLVRRGWGGGGGGCVILGNIYIYYIYPDCLKETNLEADEQTN